MKRIYYIAVLIGLITLINGCKKSATVTEPSLTTTAITGITFTAAASGGDITSDGGAAVSARGVCWNTTSGPVITDSKTTDGTGTGQYASNISGLTAGIVYYVRAYATNSAGTAYGKELSFTSTASSLATLTTTIATGLTSTTAITGGNITDDGGSNVTARGVCWSLTTGPTIDGSHTSDGTGKGSFTSNLTGLTAATIYYIRAYATNSTGTSYGNELSFTTNALQGANEVSIQSFAFNPKVLTVPVNTTVKWTNNDAVTHTVTSDSPLFSSGNLAPGGTYSFLFTTPGTFTYHCSIHTDMTASIVVQ